MILMIEKTSMSMGNKNRFFRLSLFLSLFLLKVPLPWKCFPLFSFSSFSSLFSSVFFLFRQNIAHHRFTEKYASQSIIGKSNNRYFVIYFSLKEKNGRRIQCLHLADCSISTEEKLVRWRNLNSFIFCFLFFSFSFSFKLFYFTIRLTIH